MKIAVRYQSRGGNTRAVAEVIAKTLGVKAEPISTPLTEKVDLLFIGGGVYKWDADPELKTYLQTLNAKQISKIATFSTTGGMTVAIKRISEAAKAKGIPLCEHTLCMKLLLQGHAGIGREGGHLTEKQEAEAQAFAKAAANEQKGVTVNILVDLLIITSGICWSVVYIESIRIAEVKSRMEKIFQELKICGHGTVLALYRCAQNAFSTNVSELLRRKNK